MRFQTIFILMFIVSFPVRGQKRSIFEGGISIGIALNSIIGEREQLLGYIPENSAMFGYNAGAFVKWNFTPKVYGSFELKYHRKGCRFKYPDMNQYQQYEKFVFDYIEIPIFASYKIKAGKTYILAEAGLSYAKLVKSEIHLADLSINRIEPDKEDFKNQDVSGIVGFKMPLGNKNNNKFFAGMRYEHSILSFHKTRKLANFQMSTELAYVFN